MRPTLLQRWIWWSPKTVIVGHRIWWTADAQRIIQAAIRWGFLFGLLSSVLAGQHTSTGVFAAPEPQLVALAGAWALMPSASRWSRSCFVRHEQGNVLTEPLELGR